MTTIQAIISLDDHFNSLKNAAEFYASWGKADPVILHKKNQELSQLYDSIETLKSHPDLLLSDRIRAEVKRLQDRDPEIEGVHLNLILKGSGKNMATHTIDLRQPT
ncbi:MAG: hypothetical protein LH606_03905 [Cytophagaceae bacterium]|nr:hypothetical protein [Cytophagaceae bacterium]